MCQEKAGRGNPYRLFFPPEFADSFCEQGIWLSCFAMERLLLPMERIVLHASAVLYQGKAYLFSAPSGGGKSTHAALWQSHFGAEILNGDKVILYEGENGVMACGSPIAGSSEIYKNKTAPVAALYLLKKAPHNRVTPIASRSAVLSLYSEAVKSKQDADFNVRLLDLLVSMEKKLPVFSLECLPEKSAVECILETTEGITS